MDKWYLLSAGLTASTIASVIGIGTARADNPCIPPPPAGYQLTEPLKPGERLCAPGEQPTFAAQDTPGRFAMLPNQPGAIWKMDTATGKLWLCSLLRESEFMCYEEGNDPLGILDKTP